MAGAGMNEAHFVKSMQQPEFTDEALLYLAERIHAHGEDAPLFVYEGTVVINHVPEMTFGRRHACAVETLVRDLGHQHIFVGVLGLDLWRRGVTVEIQVRDAPESVPEAPEPQWIVYCHVEGHSAGMPSFYCVGGNPLWPMMTAWLMAARRRHADKEGFDRREGTYERV